MPLTTTPSRSSSSERDPAPRRRPQPFAAILGMLGLLVTVAMGTAISASGSGPTALDTAWHDLMRSGRTDAGVAVATWFQSAGGVSSMVVVGLTLTTLLLVMRRPWSALTLAVAMLVSEAATGTMKVIVARPRPADSLSDTGLTSFPSGHTALAATTMVVLALLIGRGFWMVAVPWITAMAWSRTTLEAHWLTDVLGGAVLGASVALIVWWGARILRWCLLQRRSRRAPSAGAGAGAGAAPRLTAHPR